MPGKRIFINKIIDDEWVNKLRELDIEKINREKQKEMKAMYRTIQEVERKVKELSGEKKLLNERTLRKDGLLSVQEAYEYLTSNGVKISFRAFGGRVERKSIPSIKIGRKRYIPITVLNQMLNLSEEFYTVREAFERYKKYDPKINLRAFIGRIEKGSIPSVKINSRRLIPKVVVDALTEIRKNYYTLPEALERLRKANIRIKRNTLERRLDRRRIPFVKIGGKRYIPKEVVEDLIRRELERNK